MKGYIIILENNSRYRPGTEADTTVYTKIEIAKVAFVEKLNELKADPNKFFGFAKKIDLRYKRVTDRYVEIKDSFNGDIVNIYIHEVEIL